ncbi:calcium ion transmembrane transporter [Aureococcus anophagefferens]|uniref:Calcium ion transmembrane transporter n=1 Tax=Aureococcus anophagefferens TaxID=44056 RepID=A0ABR1FRQ8_AURAN
MPTAQERLAAASERAVPVQVGLIDDAVVVGAAPFDVEESVADVGPWLRRPIIAREAVVLERLPATPRRGGRPGPRPEPPNRVEWFCFPEGEVVLKWRKKRPPSRCHAFALHAEGPPVRGVALVAPRGACGAGVADGGRWRARAPEAHQRGGARSRRLWAPVALCLLTRLGVVPALVAWLEQAEPRGSPRAPRASAGRGARARGRGGGALPRPVGGGGSLWLAALLLGPEGLATALACVLLERPLCLHAESTTVLAPVAEALLALAAPLEWAGVYVPVLPKPLLELLDAPQAFLLGVESKWIDRGFYAERRRARRRGALDRERARARGEEPVSAEDLRLPGAESGPDVTIGPGVVLFDLDARADARRAARTRRRCPRRRGTPSSPRARALREQACLAAHGDGDGDAAGEGAARAPPRRRRPVGRRARALAGPSRARDAATPSLLSRRRAADARAGGAGAGRRRRRRAARAAAPGARTRSRARGPRGRRRGAPRARAAARAAPVAAGSLLAAGDDGSRAARTSYEQVDIACLLRNVVASSALDTARMTPSTNNDGLVQFGEIARIFGELLRVRLLDGEIEALYDLLDNSLDHIRLVDLARFLDPRDARAAAPLAPRRAASSSRARRDARLYERRFPKQVGAVALGARGLAVGCFAPGHLDYVADLGAGGGEPAPGDAAWQAGRDVNALALFERAGELAVAAGDAVVIYAVAQRAELYRFEASGTAWGVALGASENHELSRARGGPPVRFAVPSRDAEDAAEWPEWDSALARQQSTLRRAKTHRVLEVGASGDGEDSRLRVTDAGATYVHEDAALRVVEGESSRTRVVSVHESLDKKRLLGPGQDKRAKFPTSKAPLSAVFHSLGLDAALALGCVAAAALRGRGALSAAQYAAADLWVTFFYLLELVIRGICHVEVHHSLWKFARDPACVADGAVVALGLAAVFVRHAPYVSWGLALSKCARFLRAARSCARHLRGLRHARAASGRTYAVELDGGAVVGDVDRRDILTNPERRYVDMRRAAGDEVMAPRGFGAARARSGDERETRGSRGRSEAPEPLGTTPPMPRLKRFASRRWKRTRTSRAEADADPHAKGSLGERDRMPVWVRFRCASRTVETHNRCVVFRLDAGDALYSVALSRSGKSVLFGGASKEVKLCDVTTAALRYEARADDRVRAVALCGDDEVLAFGGFDATLRLHHVGRGAPCAVGECGATARAVAVDRAGAVLAVGGDDALCRCYDLVRGSLSQPSWSAKHRGKVWTVSVTPDGTRVAAGDYANAVVLYAAADGAVLWLKTSWLGKGAPFTWAVHFSGDGNTLAIGHWDAYAYLVDAADLREFGAIERGDRVYAVALSSDGGLVAVGGRDKRAAVYAVDGDHIAALFETVHEAFVYAVALSRDRRGNRAIRASFDARVPRVTVPEQASARHDDAVLAVGRVDCLVAVFDVASEARTATIAMEGLVQNLCFAPAARDLAIAAEQNTVDVWDLSDASRPREKLVVTRHATTNDVALSLRGFAFCNGTIFSTMGVGSRVPARAGNDQRNVPAWYDALNHEVARATLDHPRALRAALRLHRTLVNQVNPVSGESILQYAVRKKSRRAVDQLLHADCPIGLLGDCNGMNAITVALANERKGALSQLLDVMMTSLDGSPLAAAAFSNAHAAIADQYPDLYLDFISRSFLIHDTDVVPPGHNFALMPPTGASVTAGSDHRSPADFWSDFLVKAGARFRYFEHRESDDGAAHRPSGAFHARNSLRHMLSRRSFDGGRAGAAPTFANFATLGGAGVRAHLKKTEVAAMIVPFERVLGTFGGDAVSQDSVLALATRCAASMNDYRVFESQMVRAIIQFKWDHYARSIFIAQCVLCVFHFALVIALYVAVTPAMRLPTRWDPGDRGRPAHGLGEVFALALYLPVVLLTCFLLGLEVRQMLLEGSQNYFAGHAVWKALDLACLSLQLLVDGLLAMEVGGWLLAFFACVNVLFFNWRIISFARGFENWGPLVRMIVKIVWEVRFFSAVVALMLVGFWLAFAIGMQETPTEWLMVFLFNAGFYGEYEKDYLSGDQGFYDWRMDRQLPITTVLQLFMLIFGVLALNLLIAIMNSAYERVRASAVAEMLHEKSMIILSIERLWLPMVISAYGIPHDYFFPRWLLLLGPISILDVSEEKRRAMHDRVVGMRESLS